tara:strand:- start:2789 stop:3142 length:354 start_codon:yes stop_codon:yes gene_type:complete
MSHAYSQMDLVKKEDVFYKIESLIDVDSAPGYGLRNLDTGAYIELPETDLSAALQNDVIDFLWGKFVYDGNNSQASVFVRVTILGNIGRAQNVSYGASGEQYKLTIGENEWLKDKSA